MQALVVASVYLPIDTAPPTKELEQLVTHCENKNLPLVIVCDSNSHHTTWGSSECNARGIRLLEYQATTGLEIANIGAEPTFVAGNKRTVIDITLASGSLMQHIYMHGKFKRKTLRLTTEELTFYLSKINLLQDIVATPEVQTGRCLTMN